jgi:hypothetical protein
VGYNLTDFSDFFKFSPTIIQNKENYPFGNELQGNKIYAFSDKLVFTLDNQYHRTVVIEMNLNDLSYKITKYEQPGLNKNEFINPVMSVANSFKKDSILILTNILNGRFHLSLINMKTGNTYKTYSINDGDLNILNGDIIDIEKITKSDAETGIEKRGSDTTKASLKKLLNKLRENGILVTASQQDTVMKVTIGAFYTKESDKIALDVLSLGSGVTSGIYTPVILFNNNNYILFQSLFENQNYEHIEGAAEEDKINTEIHQFIIQNNISGKNTFLTYSQNHYYLGYYQEDENYYTVYLF